MSRRAGTAAAVLLLGILEVASGAGVSWAVPASVESDSPPADVATDPAARLESVARRAAALEASLRRGLAADTDTVIIRDGRLLSDTLETDTLAADTLEADTVALPDVEARREALASGDFPARDSVFDQLLRTPGFRIVEYRGQEVELDLEAEAVHLRGRAQTNYAASALEADTISYRVAAQFIAARGEIRLATEGQREVTSDSVLYYDVSGRRGTILDARTAFAERGSEWYVRGTATPRGDRAVFVERGSFTSCELEAPHYYFRAGQIKVVSEDVLVAWPVVLYIHEVPVAWLPFFAQDIRPGRRSGFLPPRFGVNDVVRPSSGFQRSISDFGYYFALSDFFDAQATVDWFSGNFTRLNGAVRYVFLKQFIRGNFLTSYSFGSSGRTTEFRGRHDQQITPVTDLRVSAAFVQNTRLFEDQSFDPRQQTQNIDSDFGLTHKFPFANFSLSGRRRQFLGAQAGRTDLTLPQLNMAFSPVTLFRAPPGRGGPFNNLTWSGNLNFERRSEQAETRDDVTTTRGNVNQSLRIADITLSGNAALDDRRTVPLDTLGEGLAPFSRTTVTYGGSTSYQIDLMGSTVLRPSVSLDGSAFKSPDTGDDFVSAPTRLSLGASASTDLYGFFPGFGAFTRIRHKISPRLSYRYSPELDVAQELLEIPGFPAAAARERNSISLNLSQTFEAKVRQPRPPGERDGEPAPEEPLEDRAGIDPEGLIGVDPEDTPVVEEARPPEPGAETEEPEPGQAVAAEAAGEEPRTPAETVGEAARPGAPRERPAAQAAQERVVTLLSINTSNLEFDLTRAGEEPILVTDRLVNTLSSDLLRGFNLRITHDLFDGSGPDRSFQPFLTEVSTGFNFSSAQGLSGIFGLGDRGAPRQRPRDRLDEEPDSRYRLQNFEREEDEEVAEPAGQAGPWTLNLDYSLQRRRPSEATGTTRENQSLGAFLSLQPTPNWRLQWRTHYNLSDGRFEGHTLSLDRDLHRWQASFLLNRAPNGNFLFTIRVFLRDAPELKVDYDQRGQTAP